MEYSTNMSWQSHIALIIIGFSVVVLWISTRKRSKTAPPPVPEAGGAWPLIGHLHLLGGSEPPHVTLGNMADKYGPIFTIRLGVHPTLVISSWEIAKEIFTVNDVTFATRPKNVAFEVLGYNFGMIGFCLYGAYWRHVRKLATLEVLSAQRLEMLKHVRESEVKWAVKETYDRCLKLKNDYEMKEWFGNIILNVVFRMVVGKRFVEITEGKEGTRKALRDFFDLSGSFVVSDALPFLRWLDLDGQEKEMKKTARELDHVAQVWLEEHKRKMDLGEVNHADFMDVLLSVVDDSQEHDGRDADTVIKATCLTLLLAGSDTTTVTLTWALSLLLNHPEVLKKAVEELNREIEKERVVEESDAKNLPYLQAILKETMRLYPAAPLNIPHESTQDSTVAGYHVPRGTRLLTNISKIQRDPLVYSDPLEFRPERFLTTHKGVDFRGQNFELIPFSAGRRMCPGITFALQMMHLILANLLHGFDVKTLDDEPVDMKEQVGLTNIKASPLHVILTPRLSSHLY